MDMENGDKKMVRKKIKKSDKNISHVKKDTFISMSIWEREYSLPVKFDCYADETVTDEQVEMFSTFSSNPEWINNAKSAVEEYCFDSVKEDNTNNQKENIFSYIKPDYIYVVNDSVCPRVALMCNYRYDPEHGLAIVFDSQGQVTIGLQDIVL